MNETSGNSINTEVAHYNMEDITKDDLKEVVKKIVKEIMNNENGNENKHCNYVQSAKDEEDENTLNETLVEALKRAVIHQNIENLSEKIGNQRDDPNPDTETTGVNNAIDNFVEI